MQVSSVTPLIMKHIIKTVAILTLAYAAIVITILALATFVVCTVLKQFGVI